ncbi:HalOD1 output domain-containing protein [Natrinema gelatinilyticum]|uniref:HalOD1 output domain-containing protein n=1 Tax=Natrinema gelatinilyticum TaxID=2961571 RepID=UPI0020C2CD8D|nr:HalOD1 output domain-containing protein [Natrinema gelatinilyticum]
MSNERLLLAIIHALETEGLNKDEYQLQRVIDVEALEQLVDSVTESSDLEIRFSIEGYRVLVTQDEVRVTELS